MNFRAEWGCSWYCPPIPEWFHITCTPSRSAFVQGQVRRAARVSSCSHFQHTNCRQRQYTTCALQCAGQNICVQKTKNLQTNQFLHTSQQDTIICWWKYTCVRKIFNQSTLRVFKDGEQASLQQLKEHLYHECPWKWRAGESSDYGHGAYLNPHRWLKNAKYSMNEERTNKQIKMR